MAVSQVNVRIDSSIKREGDSTLQAYGIGATDAVRSLWDYLATAKALPDFMMRGRRDVAVKPAAAQGSERAKTRESGAGEDGAGLALRLAAEYGLSVDPTPDTSYDELRELAFDELLLEGGTYV